MGNFTIFMISVIASMGFMSLIANKIDK